MCSSFLFVLFVFYIFFDTPQCNCTYTAPEKDYDIMHEHSFDDVWDIPNMK